MKQLYLALMVLFFPLATYAITPILGPTSVCEGNNISLTNATSGGTWSSSTISVATIASTSGLVTGVAAGTATITYNTGSGYATLLLTVNPIPPPITVASAVCVGSAITLTDAVSGGTWSDPLYTTFATVSSSSGIVTGVAPGTAIITYTLPTGCRITGTVTVNPAPAGIAGLSSVCVGGTGPQFGTPAGGTWSTASTAIISIGSTTGVVTGLSAGPAIITYTLATGCYLTSTITADPCPALGISPQSSPNRSDVVIYPNPATKELTITTFPKDRINVVNIYNLLGQTIYTQTPDTEQVHIDVSHLPAGVYFIEINGNEVRRFVKE